MEPAIRLIAVVHIFLIDVILSFPRIVRRNLVQNLIDRASSHCETQFAPFIDTMLENVNHNSQKCVLRTYLEVFLDQLTIHNHQISVSQDEGKNGRASGSLVLVVHLKELFLLGVEFLAADLPILCVQSFSLLPALSTFAHRFRRIV